MIVSHEWLKQFVPHALTAEDVGDLLSRHCVTLDGITHVGADLTPFVVAQVVEARRHPNSERLWVTKVDDGSGTLLDVVCGAPNVVEGTKYPFARTGTTMPGGLVIEQRRIRGEVSNGMLCSARELELGQDHDGILALDTDAAPGTPLVDVLAVSDARLDFDVLPNRPDLLSHRGLAREVSALTGVPLLATPATDLASAPLKFAMSEGQGDVVGSRASLRIEDRAACSRYVAVVVEGLRVGPSPDWLRRRLESVGVRSLGNVVDATNYVLQAFGQPVHAFDLDRLEHAAIVVRPTREGESLVTLDGVTRTLATGTTVICDGARPVALAGVMGGRDSEVTDATTRVLLEVAAFEPRFVRAVRRALGMSTDASYRFERGIDAAAVPDIAILAATLIAQVAGGEITEVLSAGAPPDAPATVTLRDSRITRLLGVAIGRDEVMRRLTVLGCVVHEQDADTMRVTPPTWRHDLGLEVDLIEEVARIGGFDVLPDELRPFRPGTAGDHPLHVASVRVRDALVASGFAETRPMPFTAHGSDDTLRVRNPLADDEPFLRGTLLDTLAGRVEYNQSRMQGDIRLFEVGNAFVADGGRLPREEVRAAAVLSGARRPPHFTEPKPPTFDLWDAKAVAQRMAEAAFPEVPVGLVAEARDAVDTRDASPTSRPNAPLWTIQAGGRDVGRVVQLAVDTPEWASDTFGVELTLGVLASDDVAAPGMHRPHAEEPPPPHHAATAARYRALPTTPAAEFDLALVVPDAVDSETVRETMRRASGELLERIQLFDEFRGESLPAGTRSLAWRLTWRHPERTLKEKEIEGRRARLLEVLDKELGIRPRAS